MKSENDVPMGSGMAQPAALPVDQRRTVALAMARVLLLGMNAWLVTLVLPMALSAPTTLLAYGLLLIPLAALLVGVPLIALSRVSAAWLLLGAFPTLVAAVASGMANLSSQWPWSTPGLLVAVLSIVAYGAGAAFAVGRPTRARKSHHRPLGAVAPVPTDPRRTLMRRAMLAVTAIGALLIAVVAPGVGARGEYERAFGAAAPEAAVLTAVVAGALATAVLAFFVGPSLRASRARLPSRRQATRRAVGLLVSAAIGAAFVAFYVLSR